MSSVKRSLAIKLKEQVGSGKALLVFGARQVGKTTLLR
jgi:predicted AAA+ superfamily ATPase